MSILEPLTRVSRTLKFAGCQVALRDEHPERPAPRLPITPAAGAVRTRGTRPSPSASGAARRAWATVWPLLLVGLAPGCEHPESHPDFPVTPPDTSEWDLPTTGLPYRIQVGDRLAVRFFYQPELDDEVVVRPDGRISLLPIDEVDAAGRTVEELDRELTERFAAEILRPDLSVIVREYAASLAYVGGEVLQPRTVPISSSPSVFTSLIAAGGPKTTADLRTVLLIRRGVGRRWYVKVIDVQKIMREGVGDVVVLPYDVVYVPRTFIANVNEWIDQYINRVIPQKVGFNFIYDVNRETVRVRS